MLREIVHGRPDTSQGSGLSRQKLKTMEKLNLTETQKALFESALNEAYQKGSQDATFLANSMYQLVETASKCIPKIIEKFVN